MTLDPSVWGPYYWFVLHTIALTYPITPNEVIKKKYYDFFQNLPLFLPIQEIGNNFSKFLDKYPVTPYLDSRDALIRWVHFIHNKINKALKLKTLTLEESLSAYYQHYKPKVVINIEQQKYREKLIFLIILLIIIICITYLYNK